MLRLRQPVPSAALLAVFLLQSTLALAQQAPAGQGIGVVTSLQGQATVGRQALSQPAPLRFKDDVFFRDRIATRERSTVRLLLGGKGTLTIREQSQVTLDESVAPDGTRRSVVGILTGKIGAAIARGLMRPGEVIEIQTPNAVAAVRGTVLIAEYIPPPGSAEGPRPVLLASSAPGPMLAQATGGAGGSSNFFVVSGQVIITPQGQPPLTLGPLQAVNVTATPTGAQAGSVQNVTPAQINDAAQGLQTGNPHTGEAEGSSTAQAQAVVAGAVADAIVGATQPAAQVGFSQQPTPSILITPIQPGDGGEPLPVEPPPVEPPPPPPPSTENTLPVGALLALNNATLGLAAGTSLATFNAGTANTITPIEIGGGGVAVVTAPLLPVTGNTITHEGAMVTLGSGAAIVGAPTDTTTPFMSMEGTTLTNTGGPVFTLSGDASLTFFGPLLSLPAGATVELAGIMALADTSHVALGPASAVVIPNGATLTLTAPGFDLTGASQLNTFAGEGGAGHLVALSSGTLILRAPLLSLAPGPGETTPQVIIGGDVLHVASTVTGPPGGNVISATAGRLTSSGDFFHIAPGGRISVSGGLVAASDATLIAATGIPGGGSPGIPLLWEPNFGSLVTNGRCDDCTTGLPGVELGFNFPFQGQNFTHAVVSGNGFLWLGGDQGSDCCNPAIPGFLAGLGRVSVGWTDWDPRFGDGGIRASIFPGRAVFTWDGVPEFPGSSHPNSRFQIQLLADGRVIFGYETLHPLASHDLLIGVTPGGGVADPGEVHFLTAVPLNTGSTGTVYELFTTGESTGLDGVALVFTPNATGGWEVTTTGSPLGGLGGAVLSILDGGELTQTGNAALFDLLRTPLTSGGDFLRMLGQSLLSLTGRLLNATDSPIAVTRSVVSILGGGQLVSTTPDSLVQTTGGSLTMAGQTSTPFEGGTLNFTTGSFLQMSSPNPDAMASLTLAGGLLHSSGTEITALNHFLDIGSNAHVTSTGADPAVVLANSPLTIAGLGSFTIEGETASSPFGNFLNICCTNSMTLTGPLLLATDSPLTVAGALISVFGGGRLASTTTDSLVKLVGGIHEIGSGTFSGEIQIGPQTFVMPASLLDLRGITTDAAGLGTDPVLQTGGTIFEANGATVNLSGSGNAISIDTALLAAAGPIVKLINSTLNTSGDGDPVSGAMRLFQSTVTSLGPVFNLDNSVLTVQSGPLLSLTGGSNMTVNGDFASLVNGSRITVVNGPLIFVDGINASGTPSTLTVTGGVVNFGGTGGNQVIVTNAIAPTAVLSGLPVNVGGGGSAIAIGPNPIKNPALGTVSINGVLAGPGPHTGSLIQATNGGRVTITAP